MCPPGLAFASVSERALEYAESRGGGRYYFDWGRTAKSQRKGASPFTPAVSLFLGLDVALGMIEAEGLDDVMARHRLLARASRTAATSARSTSSRRSPGWRWSCISSAARSITGPAPAPPSGSSSRPASRRRRDRAGAQRALPHPRRREAGACRRRHAP